MRKTIYLSIMILASIALSIVSRSEISSEFRNVEYDRPHESNNKLLKVDAKSDIPELFEQKFTIKENFASDSILQEINGFRVQIFKTGDLLEAKKREGMYIENFGEENVLLIFEKPFYKIRVGRLRNKDEAELLQETLRQRGINESIIVPDVVKVLMPISKQNN